MQTYLKNYDFISVQFLVSNQTNSFKCLMEVITLLSAHFLRHES